MDHLQLPVNEIHVWCADPADVGADHVYAAAQAIITGDERERLHRFVFQRDRLVYLATRVLVRTVLSSYLPVAPAAWRFSIGDHGRPEILGTNQLHLRFSLSNTSGLVVCAVVRELDIGVDAERVGGVAPHADIAERFFAPAEVMALRALPPEEQRQRFCDYWTLKESYLKARGLGLVLPLDRFAFILDAGHPPRIEVDPMLGDDGQAWQFAQWRPTADHVIAVCVRRRAGDDAHFRFAWRALTIA